MKNNDLIETISMCRKRIALAEAFDRVGFHGDSEVLVDEVIAVVASLSDERPGFRRFAIRGYTSRDEYIQNIAGGLGGGIGAGASMGGLAGAAIGGVAGTAVGAVKGPAQDWWFKNVNGKLSRSMALAQDFARGSQKLAAELQRQGDQAGAAAVLQAAQSLHAKVREQFETVKSQMSQQMGITPEQDKKWYSSWMPKIDRYFRMMESSSKNDMIKMAEVRPAGPPGYEDVDPATAAEEEFEKYRQEQPFSGVESISEIFTGPSLKGGSRSPSGIPAAIDPQSWLTYPWLASKAVTVPTKMMGLRIPGALGALETASDKVFAPLMWGEVGGMVGGKAGSWAASQLHGGGAQGEIRRLSGELGQIAAEIEKQMGISLEDVKGTVYQSIGGLGQQFAGEFGAGYGQQTGNKQSEQYFRNMSNQTAS
jgi:hypothetical protein